MLPDQPADADVRPLEPEPISADDRHPAAVYVRGLQSEESRRTMKGALHRAAGILSGGAADAESLPWHRVRYQHVQALRSILQERYAPSTVNKYLSAVRGVLREAWRLGYIDAETYQRAADVGNLKSERLPEGRRLELGELHALKGACEADDGPSGARDLALLAVLSRAGLRRSEAVALDVSDYRSAPAGNGDVAMLTVRSGKGERDRRVPLANGALEAVEDWLGVRAEEDGPLFCRIRRGGHVKADKRLTSQGIYHILKKRQEEAGVDPFTPHDLRRSFISDLLEYGNDLAVAQQLAGHADPATTSRYDHRGDEAKRKAAATLPF